MTASVVVVAHRHHDWLVPCLASVVEQCEEVVVVDNGSEEGAVGRAVRDYASRVVRLDHNVGFSAGVNAGSAVVRSDVIGVLNDDAFADPDWLASAAKILTDESCAAVGPKLTVARPYARLLLSDTPHFAGGDPRPLGRCVFTATAGEADVLDRLVGTGIHQLEHLARDGQLLRWRWTAGGSAPVFLPLDPDLDPDAVLLNGEPVEVDPTPVTLVNSAGTFLTRRGFAGDIGYLAPDCGQFDLPADRFGISGAALVTTRRILQTVGIFAEHFFAYYEDLDWCWRAQLAGLRVRYDPTVSVRHVGGVTSGGPGNAAVMRLAARNRYLALARNAPLNVLLRELRDFRSDPIRTGLSVSLGRRLPKALLRERRMLARRWHRSPTEVWDAWAGVNEHWGEAGICGPAGRPN
jgi:GT2 family glycosyltransferase